MGEEVLIEAAGGVELVLACASITTERAYQLGLVNRVTDGPAIDAARDPEAKAGVEGKIGVRESGAGIAVPIPLFVTKNYRGCRLVHLQ